MILKNDIGKIEGHDFFIMPVLALVQILFSQISTHHSQFPFSNSAPTNTQKSLYNGNN